MFPPPNKHPRTGLNTEREVEEVIFAASCALGCEKEILIRSLRNFGGNIPDMLSYPAQGGEKYE